jgi:peptidoglycan hydrolase CwlO-like protein
LELQKEISNLQKQNQTLQEKYNIQEKALRFKKNHLDEYLKEIQNMREKIVELEDMNQRMRTSFDSTI